MPRVPVLRRLAASASLLLAAAPAARAQPQIQAPGPAAATAPLDLGRLASPYDAGQALKAAGIARTAVDHSFQDARATAALGLLCGLAPATAPHGAPGAMGVDRDGRFLGAQLRVGFR